MKTKEQAADEYSLNFSLNIKEGNVYEDSVIKKYIFDDVIQKEVSNHFFRGVEFANQWFDVDEENPIYYRNVNVIYKYNPTLNNKTTCWLAVGDNGEYL